MISILVEMEIFPSKDIKKQIKDNVVGWVCQPHNAFRLLYFFEELEIPSFVLKIFTKLEMQF